MSVLSVDHELMTTAGVRAFEAKPAKAADKVSTFTGIQPRQQ